ncbi:glutamate receptor 2.8 [Prunus yedoensis var. nudiflora]|uniref:Glutamate receptor 2.8 n=1 Tax=Prunus yedoensis var. nudiflora TaxID=2094558 RepID=A0A314UF54_PRUYE|nr:glutamate receptor 2.8 [Prunus yedoensis var. nudiflora]
MKDGKSKNAWIFLKPLTWDLWLTSLCFFVFIGFAVWVLEHRINEEFRGPPSHQIGTSFWFSFSTMVFAQREKVVSNLARFVVIVWVFVVLILTQSYTASLTSLLTVQQLQPTFSNLSDLIKNKEYIGYINGSFVDECHEFLTNGSANGGIAAAIDETPNMKLFLAKYCSKYTMIGPIFKTDGFGFVFPKGSPLVPDVSRAILNVTEGDAMKEIENKWFAGDATCSDTKPTISDSNSLGLDSFWGLFLIAGVSSSLSLIIFAASFCYRHWHMFMTTGASAWKRIKVMLRIFDQKDLSSHTFRKTGSQDGKYMYNAGSIATSSRLHQTITARAHQAHQVLSRLAIQTTQIHTHLSSEKKEYYRLLLVKHIQKCEEVMKELKNTIN